jgi:hypothetical protein
VIQADIAKYNKEHLSIFYDSEIRMVRLKWKGFASSSQLREGLEEGLEIVKREKALFWMGDLKQMHSITQEDEEWIIQEWFPKIVLTGLKKMGTVTSLDYFNNASVNRIMKSSQPLITFETEYFVDASDAIKWLLGEEE